MHLSICISLAVSGERLGVQKVSVCWETLEKKATEARIIERSETAPTNNRFGNEIVISIVQISVIAVHFLNTRGQVHLLTKPLVLHFMGCFHLNT